MIHQGTVQKLAVVIVDIFLIEGDTQTLSYSPLHHPLNNSWVQYRATVIYRNVLENLDLSGLSVYFDYYDMSGSGGSGIGVQAPLLIGQPLCWRQPVALSLQRSSRRYLS